MIEIELKARVSDPARVEKKLAAFMKPAGKVDKSDEYWTLPAFKFRVRTEKDAVHITYKDKNRVGAVEINHETEFGVMGRDSFIAFIRRAGARFLYAKRKKGSRWVNDTLLAELVEVNDLGIFLEIETMRDIRETGLAATREIKAATAELYEALERCGLSKKDLEPRYYSELLKEP